MNIQQAPTWLPQVIVPFLTLSYPTERPTQPDSFPHSNYYGTGLLDGCFVITWILVLAVLRECLRLGFFEPFARYYWYQQDLTKKRIQDEAAQANGVPNNMSRPSNNHTKTSSKNIVKQRPKGMSKQAWHRERSTVRFAEQGWQFAYYIVYWPIGMYVHWNLPSAPFQLDRLWLNYPHIPLSGPVKFYYLTQLAFWFHQVLLLNAEAWRKDHIQMMSHHVITICLVTASYWYNFTRVGVLILVLMDWCDIFLAVVKMCRYLPTHELVVNTFFAIYAISWIITRHILFGIVIYSCYHDAPQLIPFDWAPERGHYLTRDAYIGFVCLMLALQFILCGWLLILCRIVWNVLRGQLPDDSRSDEEGDEVEDKKDD